MTSKKRDPALEEVVQHVQEQVKQVQETAIKRGNGMKAWAIAVGIGGLLALSSVTVFDFIAKLGKSIELVELRTADHSEWIEFERSDITDGTPSTEPELDIKFTINKPVTIRINSNPRNVDTGEVVCAGRMTLGVVFDAGYSDETTIGLSDLAGLESCYFTPGRYSSSLTWVLTDQATGIELDPMLMEDEFNIVDPMGADLPVPPAAEAPAAVEAPAAAAPEAPVVKPIK